MSDPYNSLGGMIGSIAGLAIAGYAVKTIGSMFHAECHHCGHKLKANSKEQLHRKAHEHTKYHPQSSIWF